jgi:hypothetical protein
MNMHDKDIEQSIQRATDTRLSDAERARTRAFLKRYMEMHPPVPHTARPAFVQAVSMFMVVRLKNAVRSVQSLQINTPYIRPMPAFIATILILASGGTAIAAEGALPGDLLYPVKVGINEEVRAAVALSAEARTDWAIERAERRLNEAVSLAAQSRLDADTQVQVEASLSARVEEALAHAAKLKEKHVEAGVEAETRLEMLLSAHEGALAEAGTRVSDASVRAQFNSVRTDIFRIAQSGAQVHADVPAIAATLSMEAESGANADVHASVEGRKRAAKNRIETARAFFNRASGRVSANVEVEAKVKLDAALEAYTLGETALEADNDREAYEHFTSAFRTALDAHTYLALNIQFEESEANNEESDEGSGDADEANGNGERGGFLPGILNSSSQTQVNINVDGDGDSEHVGGSAEANANVNANIDVRGSASSENESSGAETSFRGSIRSILGF